MSERPLNALRFMSIVVVDGATYTFPNTLLQKKKSNRARRCQNCNGTRIKEDMR